MIGFLQGTVRATSPERVLLDVGGVGYELLVPVSTLVEVERAGRDGEAVGLHVHTHLREDAITLFGFWSEREKILFEKLIAVSGIGPRLARVILSGMAPEDLVPAIAQGDAVRLATIPGVGKKTAERMVLELRDKVGPLAEELPEREGRAAEGGQDVVSALVNLGYKRGPAERAVVEARRANPGGAFAEVLRESLKRLSRA